MDFIPNHSSDQHPWFQKSLAGEEPFKDYYVWVDPKGFDQDGNPIPRSNWVMGIKLSFAKQGFSVASDFFQVYIFSVKSNI